MGHKDEFDDLPLIITRENRQRFLDAHVDPDAERFRYFAAAMLSIFEGAPTDQAQTLREIMDRHQPATLDELRNCIDAAKTLTP